MKRKLLFTKMVGAGNDFILIDNTHKKGGILPYASLAKHLCHRQKGVGADGLLFLEKPRADSKANLRMRIFNADGSQAQMCGNGIRCVAYYAYQQRMAPARLKIETLAGILEAEVKGKDRVRVQLSLPKGWKSGLSFQQNGILMRGDSVNTGVPHAVFFVEDLDRIDVRKVGASIRYHKVFQPAGTNVDFVHCNGRHQVTVRTYERGVEDETLACGTGAAAAALVAAREKGILPPVRVLTRSGEVLTVDFQRDGNLFKKIGLEGPVKILFRGEIENV